MRKCKILYLVSNRDHRIEAWRNMQRLKFMGEEKSRGATKT